jgi:hypothetical protein
MEVYVQCMYGMCFLIDVLLVVFGWQWFSGFRVDVVCGVHILVNTVQFCFVSISERHHVSR